MKKVVFVFCLGVMVLGLAPRLFPDRGADGKVIQRSPPSRAGILAESPDSSRIRNLEPEEAAKLLREKQGVVVLDVRTPEEFKAGHLSGATNINFNAPDFADQLKKLDQKKAYLVYCRSGRRSGRARDLMAEQGFSRLFNLEGGINAWTKAGQSVEK